MGLGGSSMFAIEDIAFEYYSSRSKTSQDGGLIGLFFI
jgi:hypothetical protein